jgi:hypothetical protein
VRLIVREKDQRSSGEYSKVVHCFVRSISYSIMERVRTVDRVDVVLIIVIVMINGVMCN